MRFSLRKVLGLTAIAGCSSYGIWHHQRKQDPIEFLVLDPSEAVQNLNNHKLVGVSIKSLEALYHLNVHKCEEVTKSLNKIAWTHLCIYGSILCRFILPNTPAEPNESELDNLLQRIELDDKKWKKAIRWFRSNECPEENLYCQDSSSFEKPSKMKKLNNLLQVLLYKSELENCEHLIDEDVPLFLLKTLNMYRDKKNRNLVLTIMKTLSNIAKYSDRCASTIAKSDWLPLLAEMIVNPVLPEEPVLAHKVLANMLFSFGASNYSLPPAVYELHRPNPDHEPLLDIVFVHGFRGSLFRTWRQKDNPPYQTITFWPREWLPKEFKDDPIRIIGLDYSSKLLQFGELVDDVELRAKKLKDALKTAGIGRRPVIFCVHSMGGLVVKGILANDEQLLEKTVGILFLATPHKGTPVLSSYLKYLRPTQDTTLLRVESELNKELHDRFMEKACKKNSADR